MLRELHIQNFAIIERQSIEFGPGLSVISGETGSGKSIVLQALELILGARPKQDKIRTGADGWEVQALFDLSELPKSVREELPDVAQGDELAITRSMNRAGKGRVLINGRLGTLTLLEEVTQRLMNICGQGQHIRLLDSKYHLEIIDGLAGNETARDEYRLAFQEWNELQQKLADAESGQARRIERRAELDQIIEELTPLNVSEGVRERLEGEVKRSANAEGIIKGSHAVSALLHDPGGVMEQLGRVGSELQSLFKMDPGLGEVRELFESSQISLQEFERSLTDYVTSIDVDEAALEALRERLAEIARLERKYRTNDAGLQRLLAQAVEEVQFADDDQALDKLRRKVASSCDLMIKRAQALSAGRKKIGEKLARSVEQELRELNMPESKLSVIFSENKPSLIGIDHVEIRIAPNKGEPPKALKEIASGGELSRIMLVLKKILRDKTGVNVLVFDEVDTGISGGVARAVGEKLKALAKDSQVLCITHLAQVASLADNHYLVEKQVGDRTVSLIRQLEKQEEKVDEIARMLAGYKITAASRASARELLTSKD